MTNSDMQTKQNDMTPDQARAALAWLIEMGADEIVSEEPVNRFQAVLAPAAIVPPPPQPAVKLAVPGDASACLTIADIQNALLQLDDCPLKRTASNLCFAGGNLAAPIMLIGDVPGRDEDIEGKVFAGSQAVLLEKMLGAIDLSFDAVGLFNFIPWRPPGNRAVTEAEIAMCQPFIERAIELVAPKFILTFGQLPMQCLLGRKESLMASRGKWFAYGSQKIPLLASFHPSYLTLQPAQKRLAWRDLLTFKEALDG
jgi:uracil-DNA glycosylase